MVTVKTKQPIPNTKDRIDRCPADDDYAAKYIKNEFGIW